jgi:hypothetical protein
LFVGSDVLLSFLGAQQTQINHHRHDDIGYSANGLYETLRQFNQHPHLGLIIATLGYDTHSGVRVFALLM